MEKKQLFSPSLKRGVLVHLSIIGLLIPKLVHADIVTDGSLGAATSLTGPDFAVDASLGQQRGDNLFHSLSQYHLANGESVTTSGPSQIANIVQRVSGGAPSALDGLIRSTIDGSDLFFLNSAGFYLGPNLSLDVSGSVYFSTANYIGLTDDTQYVNEPQSGEILSTASPQTFAFLDNGSALIEMDGANLTLDSEKTFALISGGININSSQIIIDQGHIKLVSIDSDTVFDFNTSEQIDSANMADIAVTDSTLNVSGAGSGSILIQGNEVRFDNSALLAKTTGALVGQDTKIYATDIEFTNGASFNADATVASSGNGGNALFSATNSVTFEDAAISLASDGSGSGGSLSIVADQVRFDNSSLDADTTGAGDGQDIQISATDILFTNGASFDADDISGNGGNASFTATNAITFEDASISLLTQDSGSGPSGSFSIQGDQVRFDNSSLDTWTTGAGDGQDIQISATDILFTNGASFFSYATPGSSGNGGNASFTSTNAITFDNTVISLAAEGSGSGGGLTLDAPTIDGAILLSGELIFNGTNPSIASLDISGTGSVEKLGTNTLTLTGNNTYSGNTVISNGTLQIGNGGTTGNLGTGNVINNSSLIFNRSDALTYAGSMSGAGSTGLLSGSIRFTGDLSSYTGTLTVDGGNLAIASNETLSLGGDYILASASTLDVAVTDDSTYSKLNVAGTATLPSNAKINIDVTDPNFTFTTGLTDGLADVLSAGTLQSDGTFEVTDNSLLFNFGAIKDGNTVDLTVTSLPSVVDSTTSPAALGAAAALEQVIFNDPTGEIASSFIPLTTAQEVNDAVESLVPNSAGGTAQVAAQASGALTSTVGSRQDSQRGTSSGDDFITDRQVWLKPFGSWAEQDTRQGVTGYDVDSHGLAIGIDGDVSSSWNVGFALGYIKSQVASGSATNPQSVDVDSYLTKVYATNMLNATTALNLQAGIGLSNYDSSRRIFTGDIANAGYDSWNIQLNAKLERSYQTSDKTIIMPYVHADYSYTSVESYSENGAGVFNLNVNESSSDSLVIGTGVKASYETSDSVSLMANGGIGYDVMTDRSALTSSFAGGGAKFTTLGIEPDELVYNAGLDAKFNFDSGLEITTSYNINARQDFKDESISINALMKF